MGKVFYIVRYNYVDKTRYRKVTDKMTVQSKILTINGESHKEGRGSML